MSKEEIETLSNSIAVKLMFLQKPILSIEEACKFTNLAKSSLYKLTSARAIPFYKTGKNVYFKRVELEQWLTNTRITPNSEIEDKVNNYFSRKEVYHA